MNLFDIFKGRKNKKGRVFRIRSVGHGYYKDEFDLCALYINGLEKDSYSLQVEKDINAPHDYVIYYENLDSENLEPVGVGYLLGGRNAGLIRLEWDLYDSSNIYVDLSRYRRKAARQVAA